MRSHIYISGAFTSVSRDDAERGFQLDNDPHLWEWPPTWGICRPDIRDRANVGDFIFFVLPRRANLPQMIYGYMKIADIITHAEAYHRPELKLKRMGNENPNGNIIVDERGAYNRFDANVHKWNFDKIKCRYAIGCANESEFFTPEKIRHLAPEFLPVMNGIFGMKQPKSRIIDLISRWGRDMSACQTSEVLGWLKSYSEPGIASAATPEPKHILNARYNKSVIACQQPVLCSRSAGSPPSAKSPPI